MPTISESKNRIIVHVGDTWKKYEKQPELFEFRVHDIGRPGKTQRLATKYRGKWQTYAWSFTKDQVKKIKKRLFVYDTKALKLLIGLKREGELKGYSVVDKRK